MAWECTILVLFETSELFLFMYMSVCLLFVCGYLRPGEVAESLKLGLQAVVSHLLWVLGSKPGFLQVQQMLLTAELSF